MATIRVKQIFSIKPLVMSTKVVFISYNTPVEDKWGA